MSSRSGLLRLLDAAFGLFVWAAHFLAVYVGAALACVLGINHAVLLVALSVTTVLAAALVAGHALRRYRHLGDLPDERFRMAVTTGCDGIALVAIVWQFFPIALVPACV